MPDNLIPQHRSPSEIAEDLCNNALAESYKSLRSDHSALQQRVARLEKQIDTLQRQFEAKDTQRIQLLYQKFLAHAEKAIRPKIQGWVKAKFAEERESAQSELQIQFLEAIEPQKEMLRVISERLERYEELRLRIIAASRAIARGREFIQSLKTAAPEFFADIARIASPGLPDNPDSAIVPHVMPDLPAALEDEPTAGFDDAWWDGL